MSAAGRWLGSSVGRKGLMGITGLLLCLFLCAHLLGNLALLLADDGSVTLAPGGPHSSEFFVWVAHHYEAVPLLFHLGELALLALFGTHALLGLTLWLQNRAARGAQRYVVQKSEGGRTWGSATMPYTGALFIGGFLVLHLINFRFGPQSSPDEMYLLVGRVLGTALWAEIGRASCRERV